MALGIVKKWFSEKGYGFILGEDEITDTFFHVKEWRTSGMKGEPSIGDKVKFDIAKRDDGRTFATKILKT